MQRLLPVSVVLLLLGCRDELKDTGETGPSDTGESTDADGDGSPAGVDCDDLDASTFPGAPEVCDERDNDCDGDVDEGVLETFFQDADGDGYGSPFVSIEACEAAVGFADNTGDCNDLDASVNPDGQEICDTVDNDCDGVVDEPDASDASTWYADHDGDGWGATGDTTLSCSAPVGYVLHDGDCDDANPSFHPGALEADCTDASDYNCDGSVGFEDADADGYAACEDCDDTQAAVNEAATEVCDGIDNDCDGTADEDDAADAVTWYGDSDGDGHGGTTFQVIACTAPVGYVSTSDDCDDLDASSYPGASESCDTADNDCDGQVDEGVELTFYADADGDGYGDSGQPTQSCTQPPGYSANGDDCNDDEPSARPGGLEVCDGLDNDCNGTVDDDALDADTWYPDGDGDGYGSATGGVDSCSAVSGYVADGTDCADSDAARNPAAAEACNGVDDDCDGSTDEADATDATTWYQDLDGDGAGNAAVTTVACNLPTGHATTGDDCDDSDSSLNQNDLDADGYSTCSLDCDDTDGALTPLDGDGDGASTCDGDCDDGDSSLNLQDVDGDGFSTCSGDCLDTNSSVNPSVTEVCDGVDNNCDGTADEGTLGSDAACPGTDCAGILLDDPSLSTGVFWIDPDNSGTSFQVSCDMSTDSGGWTMVFHIYDHTGMSNDVFQSTFGHALFTEEDWSLSGGSISSGLANGLTSLGGQGALDIGRMAGLWDDVRMTCSQSSGDASEQHYAQVDGYASTNGSTEDLLGAASNGTSYSVDSSLNSFGQSTIWHDNETNTQNSGNYLCDYTNDGSSGTTQFSFCYTDFLNNLNQDPGDTIVGIAFGHQAGSDTWSTGFSGECGNMVWDYLRDSGTFSIWVR
jgi:hypothetical protein